MFKALIVDDEQIERKALSMIIEREIPEVEVTGEAENGRRAIDLAERLQPDIMLVDIKMPGIDGIEAVKTIRRHQPQMKFIMVTAFDTFEYAREMMQEGVKHYVLKPSRKDEIVDAIQKVIRELREERQTYEQHLSMKHQFEQALSFVRSEWIMSLLMDHVQEKSLAEWGEIFDIRSHSGYVAVVSFIQDERGHAFEETGDQGVDKIRLYAAFKEKMNHAVQGQYLLGPLTGWQIPILVLDGQLREAHFTRALHNVVQHFRHHFAHMDMRVGIGSRYADLHDLTRSYQEALTALGCTHHGQPVIAYSPRLHEKKDFQYPYELEKRLLSAVKNGYADQAVRLFENYVWEWTEKFNDDTSPLPGLSASIRELFVMMIRMVKDMGLRIPDIHVPQGPGDGLSVEQMKEQAIIQLRMTADRIRRTRKEEPESVLHRAKAYIHDHYDQAVSLESVAEHVGLSPYYFSKLFKEQFAVTFIEYLTEIRLNKAKQLLADPQYSLKEICFNVGYKDPNYFSRVFKKRTGMSPSEYRSDDDIL